MSHYIALKGTQIPVLVAGSNLVTIQVLHDIMVDSRADPSDKWEIALSHHCRGNSETHNCAKSRKFSGV